jgi:hypothetical protein
MVLAKPQQPILDNGKHWEADKLERKKVADYLTPLVESITQPFVISLTSDYGTGKTFFIKCWRKDLEAKGFSCVYFNAWETDFSQDPLFAFIAAMKRELRKTRGASAKLNEATKKAGGLVAKKFAVIAGKAVLRAGIGSEAAKEVLDLAHIDSSEVVETFGKYAEERLRNQESAEKSLVDFKRYLETTIQELVIKKSEDHKKIVVFVDDLDRCRPDYAITVLECIKHLFNVGGLIFVLSIDDKQLSQTVKAVYGPNADSDGYLRRFIDWKFTLPKPSITQFIDFMFHNSELYKIFPEGQGASAQYAREFTRVFAEVCDALGFSLRKVEQIFTELNLTLRIIDKTYVVLADRFAFFACLRHVPNWTFSENPSDQLKLKEFLAQNLSKLEFRNAQTHFVLPSDVSAHWFHSVDRFEPLVRRTQEIERRLGQLHEARSTGKARDEAIPNEREKLMAEASEIDLIKYTLRMGGVRIDYSKVTFFGFFNNKLDATAYFHT